MNKTWVIVILIIIAIILGLVIYSYYNIYIPMGKSDKDQFFEVVEGESTTDIAQNLCDKGFIRSPFIFGVYAGLTNAQILPGIYYLKENMNIPRIIAPMTKGSVEEYKITTIEGWRREEIASYLEKKGLIKEKDFLTASQNKEGYLFPDTYRVAKQVTSEDLVNLLVDNFHSRTKNLPVTPEIVTLASIVEREAKRDEDRAKIAGVYKNRLDAGMKLDADPTIQYAKGDWEPLKVSDYKNINSPFNTYLNSGLPPGPICNPGLASINAAVNPEKSDYFYFFHLKDGTTIYSKDLAEHQDNLAKYKDQR